MFRCRFFCWLFELWACCVRALNFPLIRNHLVSSNLTLAARKEWVYFLIAAVTALQEKRDGKHWHQEWISLSVLSQAATVMHFKPYLYSWMAFSLWLSKKRDFCVAVFPACGFLCNICRLIGVPSNIHWSRKKPLLQLLKRQRRVCVHTLDTELSKS